MVWDIDKDGVPHDLGVLGHFDAVVWYLGDNRLTQDAVDEPVQSVIGPLPDSQVADRAKDTVLNVRSYLNEGGKLIHTGETTSYFGPLREANGGGIYYGLKGHPERPCFISTSFRDDCELLSDDFMQYYLGAYDRADVESPTEFVGEGPLDGTDADLAGTPTNPINEAGGFEVTSTVLPPDQFPQFRSLKGGDYVGANAPFEPVEGEWYVAGTHQDALYRRLTRTIDLTSVTAAQVPTLQAQLNYSTEDGYDHVIVEARTAGGEDWTTLPGQERWHLERRPGRVRGRLLRRDAPVPVALPDRRRTRARPAAPAEPGTRSPASPTAGSRSPSTWRPTPASGSRSRSPT